MRFSVVFSSLFALSLFVGCGEKKANHDLRRDLLEGLGTEVFVPNYVAFEKASKSLETKIGALCDAPSAESLASAKDAWWATRAPWKENEVLAFGPYKDEPLRIGPKVDTWPARTADIDDTLNGTGAVDAAAVAELGVTRRGLPVIEYLLYVTPEGDVETVFAKDSRRCAYLGGLVADVASLAVSMQKAWDPHEGDYLSELVDAGRGESAYKTVDLALGEVVNRLVFTIENIRGDKLGGPLGNRTDGTPQPESAESRFSGRSLEDVRDNLRGIEKILFGAKKNGASLSDYLETLGQAPLAGKIRKALDASYAALEAIGDPLTESITGDREDVQAAIDELAKLQTLIQVDAIDAMDLTLTFNDADGD